MNVPVDRVGAAFFYAATGRTVRPVDLLDEAGADRAAHRRLRSTTSSAVVGHLAVHRAGLRADVLAQAVGQCVVELHPRGVRGKGPLRRPAGASR